MRSSDRFPQKKSLKKFTWLIQASSLRNVKQGSIGTLKTLLRTSTFPPHRKRNESFSQLPLKEICQLPWKVNFDEFLCIVARMLHQLHPNPSRLFTHRRRLRNPLFRVVSGGSRFGVGIADSLSFSTKFMNHFPNGKTAMNTEVLSRLQCILVG